MLRVGHFVQGVGEWAADIAVDHRGIGTRIARHDEDAGEVDGGEELLVEPKNAEDPGSHEEDREKQDDRPVAQAPGDDASQALLLFCTTIEPPSLDQQARAFLVARNAYFFSSMARREIHHQLQVKEPADIVDFLLNAHPDGRTNRSEGFDGDLAASTAGLAQAPGSHGPAVDDDGRVKPTATALQATLQRDGHRKIASPIGE